MTETIRDRLQSLASDLWWSWQPGGADFWRDLDPDGWIRSGHNPVAIVADLAADAKVDEVALDALLEARRAYREAPHTWHDEAGRPLRAEAAYFSAEFGIHESLPIYSGGLGILAGDHVKSASDLGLTFVAVGLLYRNGYVGQQIDEAGNQHAEYPTYDYERLAPERTGHQVEVPIAGRTLRCDVWVVQVGRVKLYLLDSDVEGNDEDLRPITARLYGGGPEMRIRQELVLGVGGVRALAAMGYEPQVFHLNEGHSSFLSLERLRSLIAAGVPWEEALSTVRQSSVFTTHTPVEAGHDRFAPDLAWAHLGWFGEAVGLDRDKVLALGRWPDEGDPGAPFNMTLLAMRCCARLNGVAGLHGEVSRTMFARFWPGRPEGEVPITHITNGVHAPSWQDPALYALLAQHLPAGFRDRPVSDPVWKGVDAVPDEALAAVHREAKGRLLELARKREAARRGRLGLPPFADRLDVDALTIGFARRFAPYKRANLLFSDLDRLLKILETAGGPVQLLFAGKAHPADKHGQALVRAVYEASQHPALAGRVLLVEGYDIELGRALVQGVDVWLNNPRRPKEASGTSGMKVGMNGGLNLSILDGWWPEGFDGDNGWVIGEAREYPSVEAQDGADADSLYRTLAGQVLPTWFSNRPRWMEMMKDAIRTVTPGFHSDRQVRDYVHHLYCPG